VSDSCYTCGGDDFSRRWSPCEYCGAPGACDVCCQREDGPPICCTLHAEEQAAIDRWLYLSTGHLARFMLWGDCELPSRPAEDW
jgi:hypothetical protein